MRSSTIIDMRMTCLTVALLVTGWVHGQSKSLVADPGFEKRTDCPRHYTRPNEVLPLASWWLPTKGTADLFTPCARSVDVSVPENLFGHQRPRSGESYAGFGSKDDRYAEYLQTRLSRGLRKGYTYEVSYYVSLADLSREAARGLGACLSKQRIDLSDTKPLAMQPQVRVDTAILDTMNWVRVSGRFIAEGGERYLTIGCFPDERMELISAGPRPANAQPYAYYYLDDAQVTELAPAPIPVTTGPRAPTPEVFVVGDVLFDHDAAVLKPEATLSLDSLYLDHLKEFAGSIEITGHADSTGTDEHNLRLSRQRAEAVAAYLRSRGVDPHHLTVSGAGSTSPLSSNATDEGRRRNRRVEIKLIE